MFKLIMVPLDGSPLAERALPYASTLARATRARLLLVRVTLAEDAGGLPEQNNDARAYLIVTADTLRGGDLQVETALAHHHAEEIGRTLGAVAAERGVDAIVMSTHGKNGLDRWLFGSVADLALRLSEVPVLLVRATSKPDWRLSQSPRVLVPLDGSELAEAALGPSAALARALQARLVLLRVVEPLPPGYLEDGYSLATLDPNLELDSLQEEAESYLERAAASVRGADLVVGTRVAVGSAAALIARVAHEEGVDLIAMATHGRGGLARLVLGSVATATLQQAEAPLLLFRPAALQRLAQEQTPEPEEEPVPGYVGP